MKADIKAKIAFLGGDMRASVAVKCVADGEWYVQTWRVPECETNDNITVCDSMYKAIAEAKAIVLPLPASSDGITLNCQTENS